MTLFSAVLVASFGQNSSRPRHSTVLKLAGLLGLSGALGICLRHNAQAIIVPHWPADALPFLVILLGIQIAVVASLVGSRSVVNQQDRLGQLLVLLPLTSTRRWWLLWLPQSLLVLCTLIILIPPVVTIGTRLGVSIPIIFGSIIVGLASSYGLMFGRTIPKVPRITQGLIVIAIELWLTRHSINLVHSLGQRMPYIIVQLYLLVILCTELRHLNNGATSRNQRTWMPSGLVSYKAWPLVKTLRSYTGSRSLLYAFSMSGLVAVAAMRTGLADLNILYGTAALLVASCAADLRCLSSTYRPAEITGLRGAERYCLGQIGASLFVCLCALPIVLVTLHNRLTLQQLIWGLLEVVIGGAAGNLAGTLLAHDGRDVSGQFVGIMVSIGILWAAQTILALSVYSVAIQDLAGGVCITLLSYITYAIEFNRNPFKWRHI